MSEEKDKGNAAGMGTADLGFVAVGKALVREPTEAEIARALERTLREMRGDRYTNPQQLRAPERTQVANAPRVVDGDEPKRGSSFQEPAKLESPMPKGSFVEGVVGGMIDNALGPAVPGKREESAG
jgi:hypothetical protein